LSAKQGPSPIKAMRTPAIAGPISSAPLKMKEFNAMALGRSLRSSMMSTMKAWRAVISKALTTPSSPPRTNTCQTAIRSVTTSTANTAAWSAARAWVTTMMRWRLSRSANTPANGTSKKSGMSLINPTTPNISSDFVKR
jgi:hypothetical protein